jgi:hypothetical protein
VTICTPIAVSSLLCNHWQCLMSVGRNVTEGSLCVWGERHISLGMMFIQ